MTGPTTVGSIDAKLNIDASEFDRKADEAKVTAHELGELSPTVKVDANVGPALAKLEAVAAAERNLEAAYLRSAVAQNKLDASTKKYGEDSNQAAMAKASLLRAMNTEATAESKLSGLRQQASADMDKESESTDKTANSHNRATQSTQGHTRALSVLIAMSPAILAAAAPIGAAAVGLGAAFGVMAGAGVAAFAGIKQAMAVGDSVGNQYAAGLSDIKGNLDQLAGTAANGMLSAFNQTVGDINQHMPFLNQTVGVFATLLGNVGGTALNGVLTGLQAMNPLLIQGGAELSKFVSWLTSFTSTNGFTDFVNYAINNLPSVMHLIESLVTLAGNIIAAFAPLGPVVVSVLSGITDALNALPLPMLAGLVTTAVTIAPAMKLASGAIAMFGTASATAAGEVTLFGMAANLAVPVVGILLAAVAGIGMAFAASAAGSQKASDSIATYTSELEQSNGVIDESIQKSIAKALVDNGAAQAAKDLGIGTSELTGYVTGNADAQANLEARIKSVKDAYDNSSVVVDDYGRVTHLVTKEQQGQYDAAVKLEKGLNDQKGAIDQSKTATELYTGVMNGTTGAMTTQGLAAQDMASRYGMTTDEYNKAKTTQQQTADQIAQTTANMRVQGDVAGLLKMALDNLNGKTLSAAQAQNQFDSQIANMSTHLDATGKTINRADTDLQGMTASAVKNRGELIGLVTAAQTNAEAFRNQGHSAEDTSAKLESMKQTIIDNAVAHGEARDQVEQLVNSLFKIPPVEKSTVEVETDNANAKIAAVKALLASTNGTRAQAYIDLITVRSQVDAPGASGSSVGGRANGSLAGGMATGGIVPQYFASGGFPGGPRGTDTVPTWLTPGEAVLNVSAVKSLGTANVMAANRTGRWPGQGGGADIASAIRDGLRGMTVTVMNPFTGEQVTGMVQAVASNAISGAVNDAKYRRVGV